jgi:hypothetical protein
MAKSAASNKTIKMASSVVMARLSSFSDKYSPPLAHRAICQAGRALRDPPSPIQPCQPLTGHG